jgi:hypothetical protein
MGEEKNDKKMAAYSGIADHRHAYRFMRRLEKLERGA